MAEPRKVAMESQNIDFRFQCLGMLFPSRKIHVESEQNNVPDEITFQNAVISFSPEQLK